MDRFLAISLIVLLAGTVINSLEFEWVFHINFFAIILCRLFRHIFVLLLLTWESADLTPVHISSKTMNDEEKNAKDDSGWWSVYQLPSLRMSNRVFRSVVNLIKSRWYVWRKPNSTISCFALLCTSEEVFLNAENTYVIACRMAAINGFHRFDCWLQFTYDIAISATNHILDLFARKMSWASASVSISVIRADSSDTI